MIGDVFVDGNLVKLTPSRDWVVILEDYECLHRSFLEGRRVERESRFGLRTVLDTSRCLYYIERRILEVR